MLNTTTVLSLNVRNTKGYVRVNSTAHNLRNYTIHLNNESLELHY